MGTSQVKNLFHDYDGFTEKFKPKKTTDDCYTPPEVYNAVLNWVKKTYNIGDRPIVRPFYPGGDYEYFDYPEGCVVVDNPPFSIYSKICRFYKARGIDFFLFGPHLTLAVKDLDVTFIVTDTTITYANGAKVNTGFVTNLDNHRRIWVCSELKRVIDEAQKIETSAPPKLSWPRNFTSIALLGAVGGEELELLKNEVIYTDNVGGRKVFGGGFILSDEAVEKIEAAKRARIELEKKQQRATVEFGARELYLLNQLNSK